jgi:hypothetical protein
MIVHADAEARPEVELLKQGRIELSPALAREFVHLVAHLSEAVLRLERSLARAGRLRD